MLLWEWDKVHGDFVQIHIKITLIPHGTRHIIDHIRHDRIFLFEVVFLFLYVGGFDDRAAVLNLILQLFISSKCAFSLLYFFVLLVDSLDDVEEGLIINRKNTVGVVDQDI